MRVGEMTEEELRELVAVYYGMITKTDHNLGLLLDALQRSEAWDNTIVIASSDHGDYAGDYGITEKAQNTFEDVLTNVPLAIRVPGRAPLPAVSDALVETMDLFATLTEACDVEVGHTHFSRSLLPLLSGATTEHRQHVFTEGGARRDEVHTHETELPHEEIYWARLGLQINEPDCHGKAVMIRSKDWKYVRRLYDTDELYDLTRDPEELTNVIDDPQFEPVRRELADSMLDWFLETGDQVPWRWDLRGPKEPEPAWSRTARARWFAGRDD
jgi:arylsulfatase A-like enzyme